MLWGFDADSLVLVAKDRHAEMLEYATRERQLKQSLPRREHKRTAWQWLRQTILGGLPKERPLEPSSTHHSILQS